jgi:hypothetical protein
MKTKTFKVTIEDKEQTILVRSPSLDDQREGQKAYNQAFTDAVKSNSVVRAKLDDLLESQGLWNDEKQAQFTLLQKQIADGEKRLQKGGFSLNEAKDLAVKIKGFRDEIRDLISVRTSLDNHSAEGQADNARFNYLVSACVVYNDTKEKVFTNLADYIDKSSEPVAIEGAQILANMLYGLDNNYETNLPENKFLKKYKFVDEELRFVDKKGRLIDGEGRLIDEDSRYIDEAGNFVDKYGTKLKDDGEYDIESKPFLDEDGTPIIISEETNEAPPKTKKSKPKPKQEPLEEEPESS